MNQNYGFYQQSESTGPIFTDAPKKTGAGFAVASLVLGILALLFITVCCCFIYISPVLAILSIVFAIVARVKMGKFSRMIIAGLILSVIALLIFIVFIIGIYQLMAPLATMTPEESLKYFAELSGMSEEEFRALIESSAGMTYEEFVEEFQASQFE